MVGMNDLVHMARCFTLGQTFEQAGLPDTPENHAAWDTLVTEIDGIKKRGGTVDLPFEAPSAGQVTFN